MNPKIARLVPQPEGTAPEEMVHISSFALIRRGPALLLARRLRPERWAGKWCIPSSLINYGEDPSTAIRRIVKEQLGAEGGEVRLIDVQSFGDKHWDICFLYSVNALSQVKVSQDFEKAEYFDLADLPSDLREDHKEVIEMARGRRAI